MIDITYRMFLFFIDKIEIIIKLIAKIKRNQKSYIDKLYTQIIIYINYINLYNYIHKFNLFLLKII